MSSTWICFQNLIIMNNPDGIFLRKVMIYFIAFVLKRQGYGQTIITMEMQDNTLRYKLTIRLGVPRYDAAAFIKRRNV